MPISIEAKVVSGLLTHFQGVTLPAGMRIAYPNVDFPGLDPSGQPLPMPAAGYVRLTVAKNTPTNPHISGVLTVYRGIFLAVVCWPVNKGLIAPSEFAGTIRDHFAFDGNDRRIIQHDGIEISIGLDDAPRVAGDEQGPVYTEIPVVIPWTVYP